MKRILLLILFLVLFGVYVNAGEYSVTLIDAHVFDTTNETDTSSVINVQGYDKLGVYIDVNANGLPTSMEIIFELSDDGTTFYKINQGSFSSLSYDTVDAKEYYITDLSADFLRSRAISVGCDADSTYTTSVSASFNRY